MKPGTYSHVIIRQHYVSERPAAKKTKLQIHQSISFHNKVISSKKEIQITNWNSESVKSKDIEKIKAIESNNKTKDTGKEKSKNKTQKQPQSQ